MEWLDNLKQEIAYPFVTAREWYDESDENRFAVWFTVVVTAVAALAVYGGLFFGGRAVVRAVSDDVAIYVASDNECLTQKGLVKDFAPASCYETKRERQIVPPSAAPSLGLTRNTDATVTPASDDAYNPPSDKVYSKRLIKGVVDEVTFHSEERLTQDNHLQPDYTEVSFAAPDDDHTAPDSEKFCGNVLDMFSPGDPLGMVIGVSKLSDYNGCYTVRPVRTTFGGDYYRPKSTHPVPLGK